MEESFGTDDTKQNFVVRMYSMLSTKDNDNTIVSWAEDGTSFIIHNGIAFAEKVMPRLFKHNKYPSFLRQMNAYGFRKGERYAIEFYHPNFRANKPELLPLVKRKQSGSKKKAAVAAATAAAAAAAAAQTAPVQTTSANQIQSSMLSTANLYDWLVLNNGPNALSVAQTFPSSPVQIAHNVSSPISNLSPHQQNSFKDDLKLTSSPISNMPSPHSVLPVLPAGPSSTPEISNLRTSTEFLVKSICDLKSKQSQTLQTVNKILEELLKSRQDQQHLNRTIDQLGRKRKMQDMLDSGNIVDSEQAQIFRGAEQAAAHARQMQSTAQQLEIQQQLHELQQTQNIQQRYQSQLMQQQQRAMQLQALQQKQQQIFQQLQAAQQKQNFNKAQIGSPSLQ
eukprot:TRINITY_DN5580_c0_g1_i1.p1 TRINITY_DN5580_c0_g1~~TRINITY_DN5580_c0_g1_i1.p1  ORF type:complete len:393 (+),score=110.82 TRINITY_DN5580_c0_g1_i1:195-1373(+)